MGVQLRPSAQLTSPCLMQQALFKELDKVYRKLEKQKNPGKIHDLMKVVTEKLKECKA